MTTYRLDGSYRDHRHPDNVQFVDDLAADLARRDFTINAMAYAPGEGVIDLYGGRSDLAARVVRCVGTPADRFAEDALRILRALRFSAKLGFALDPATEAAALAAREMVLEEHPEKQIFVLDTLSCSGALAGAAELANKLIGEDQTFDDICFALKKFADSTHILFALASFDNLAKNGRVNRVVGFIAGRLNMRVLGRRTPDGKIDPTQIVDPAVAGDWEEQGCKG